MNRYLNLLTNWPIIVTSWLYQKINGISHKTKKITQTKTLEVKITEEVSAVKPTKWKPDPVPSYKSSNVSQQFKENKKSIEKQKKYYEATDTWNGSPLSNGIYFKLNQPGFIPETPMLQFLGNSRIDNKPCYCYYGDDLTYYNSIYSITEIHNL